MRRLPVLVCVAAIAVVVLALPGVATAKTANDPCFTCHAPGGAAVNQPAFRGGGAVDYAKCNSCHWIGMSDGVISAFVHGHALDPAPRGGPDCGSCHKFTMAGYSADLSRLPLVYTSLGYFNTSESPSMGAPSIHSIHANGSWPMSINVGDYPQSCQSCHMPPSCNACHTEPDLVTHTDHTRNPGTGVYANPPVTRLVGAGTPVGQGWAVNVQQEQSTCINDACHSLSAVGSVDTFEPTCVESCHSGRENDHGYDAAQHTSTWMLTDCIGSGCHTSRELMPEHEAANASYNCATCHGATVREDVKVAIRDGVTACGACHPGVTETQGHVAAHYADPPLANNGTGNYGYYLGTAATTKTSACADCHTENLMDEHMGTKRADGTWDRYPRETRTGDDLTCASCHASANGAVIAAITSGATNCDACHTVHGPMNPQHASTYMDDPPFPCAPCHSSYLQDEHGSVSTTTPSGKVLSDCAVCHQYYEGAYGQSIQDAIEVTNATDHKCTACHPVIHPDTDAVHTTTQTMVQATECTDCHDDSVAAGVNVKVIHADASLGECAVCHDNPARVPDITSETVACVSCHATAGTDYHIGLTASHTSTQTSCAGSGCHAIGNVASIHASATVVVGGVTLTGCDVCHQSPTVQPTSTDCYVCHEGHGDLTAAHTATAASKSCVDCHETYDARTIHADSPKGECAVCHDNPAVPTLPASVECANCHADRIPISTKHYSESTHRATAETGCNTCHFMSMDAEHSKSTVSPVVTCVSCHETKVDAFTSAWNDRCSACHATKHTAQDAKHVSTNTTCDGTGCHVTTNVASIHTSATVVVGGVTLTGCNVCHQSPTTVPASTECSVCHTGVSGDHHALHDASGDIPPGCNGCHYTYIDDEHSKLGYTCDTCHSSADPAVISAIAANNVDCDACHPLVNGQRRHQAQEDIEFVPSNASGHKVDSTLPWAKSSYVVNGTTYSWSLPTNYLKTGWTSSSVVTCDKCHNYASSAGGPHGSSVPVNMDPAYPADYHTATIYNGSMRPSNLICNKCHYGNANQVHNEGDHEGELCIACHTSMPHAWRLPRLLAYTTDPAPYKATRLTGISLKSHTPNNWDESDCAANCDDHGGSISNKWPSVTLTVGNITGKVTNSSGVAISGATVTTDKGQSTTSDASGNYTFSGLSTGGYSVTVAKTGYTTQTKSATVATNQTLTLNFTMVLAPVTTGTLTGTVTDSATSAKLSGVTVSVGALTATTDSNGAYTIANITAGTVSVTYAKTGYTSQTKSVAITAGGTTTSNVALVVAPVYANVALNKTATASSSRSSYDPYKAFDGSTSTRWYSNGNGTQWLRVDLGSAKSVDKVVVYWYSSYYGRSYRVQYSNDGSSWTDAYSTSSGSSGTKTHTFSAKSGRYWRVYATSANSSNGYSITELQVWGQ